MNETGEPAPPPRDAVFRMIQWVMLGDVVIGLALIGLGLFALQMPALIIVGAALAVIGGGMSLAFRQLARRAAATSPALAPRRNPHEIRR